MTLIYLISSDNMFAGFQTFEDQRLGLRDPANKLDNKRNFIGGSRGEKVL